VLNSRIVNGKNLSDILTARTEIVQFVRVQRSKVCAKWSQKWFLILFWPLDLALLEKDVKLKILKLSVGLLIDLMKNMMSENSKVYINGSSWILKSVVL